MRNDNNYEEEFSVLEIVKYNIKNWGILLLCVIIGAGAFGAYGYKNTVPSVIHYETLQQMNGSFFMADYNSESISERLYDAQQVASSHEAYEKFIEKTGYSMDFGTYCGMFKYNNYLITSVMNLYVAYPETYGDTVVENEEQAAELMLALMETQEELYAKYMGEGAIEILSRPYSSSFSQADANAAVTTKDLITQTSKGALAGGFLGLLLGIVFVTIIYLIGTVAKKAKEIEERLEAPAIAFVHKKDKEEEFKKVRMYLEHDMKEHNTICYFPYHAKNADGAHDLAKAFANVDKSVLYMNLSEDAACQGTSLSDYLFGKCSLSEVVVHKEDNIDIVSRNKASEDGKELLSSKVLKEYIEQMKEKYDCVIINAPDVMKSSDAYGIALYCDKALLGCKRREVTGTDLYEIRNTLENNEMKLYGVVVYGN